MDPYCRYCHNQDHVLANCEKRLSSIICYNCNGSGHISRLCPRRNTPIGAIYVFNWLQIRALWWPVINLAHIELVFGKQLFSNS
jgi:hypothetical protein